MDKIIVDGMGGDNAPASACEGVARALNEDKNLYIILTGRKAELENCLKNCTYPADRLEIVDCPDVIDMNDIPTEAVKKKNSSLMQAFWMLKKNDDIAGLVTAGSTGATIVGGQLILGRIRGIKRPALTPAVPNVNGKMVVLCDCGANAECKPSMLCQFALLGSAYSTVGLGVKNPKVGLLNNGTEEHKGDPVHQQAYKYLTQMKGINFVGNIEGRDINTADIDVVVSDGFSGNIALKTMEGTAKMILKTMKKQLMADTRSKLGALLCKKAIKRMRADLDFEAAGGAMLLGVKKVVVKNHGSSTAVSICNAVHKAAELYRSGLIQKVESLLEQADLSSVIAQEDE
ncbi:MAG TPA: phosphate acyltransferase PlsX [Candidatus Coproplasma excrementipullorum]|nr:phosphate acyltransferase PlsX [Candidatus Coproplasma excrementipullorum]